MPKFYFSIIDDTDDATLENIKPIYDFLYEQGVIITKTVWVYPPLDEPSKGDCLQRSDYADYIKELHDKGFEIGIHNIGSADYDSPYTREKILEGLEFFEQRLGFAPTICVNHSYNPDSVYGGYKRFNNPMAWLVKKLYKQYGRTFYGEVEGSPYFWGDKHKEMFKYSRNHECGTLLTTRWDRKMPYVDPKRSKYANYWYSATFAPNQDVFNYVMNEKALRKLEKQGGCCIMFTHLGYYCKDGVIDPGFVKRIKAIAANPNSITLPVTQTLDILAENREKSGKKKYPTISYGYKMWLEIKHLLTRIKFRYFVKLDDYAFKDLKADMFVK